jgi:hypothetical protein
MLHQAPTPPPAQPDILTPTPDTRYSSSTGAPLSPPARFDDRGPSAICRCDRAHHTAYFCSTCGGALLPSARVVLP